LAAQPRSALPDEVRDALAVPDGVFVLEPEHWEPVARTLSKHLSQSGEFTYTLELSRKDSTLDPVMDFLVNVKQGHCERYASALTLMLRAVGIPARIVKGYRGADSQGDGTYLVRHRHAHAWVEILSPRRDTKRLAFDWVTFDPTPSESAPSKPKFSLKHWLQESQRNAVQLWREMIVDFNADEQADLWSSLKPGRRLHVLLKLGLLLATVVVVLSALAFFRRAIRRRRRAARLQPDDAATIYRRLVDVLARRGFTPPPSGQTPREFADRARPFLQALLGLTALVDLPIRVVEQFYRARFGGRSLEGPERQLLDTDLDRLALALRQAKRLR
jgi:hypothetical protein